MPRYDIDDYETPDFIDVPLTDEHKRTLAELADLADEMFGDFVYDPADMPRPPKLRIVRD